VAIPWVCHDSHAARFPRPRNTEVVSLWSTHNVTATWQREDCNSRNSHGKLRCPLRTELSRMMPPPPGSHHEAFLRSSSPSELQMLTRAQDWYRQAHVSTSAAVSGTLAAHCRNAISKCCWRLFISATTDTFRFSSALVEASGHGTSPRSSRTETCG
jgi:hypothetical protein